MNVNFTVYPLGSVDTMVNDVTRAVRPLCVCCYPAECCSCCSPTVDRPLAHTCRRCGHITMPRPLAVIPVGCACLVTPLAPIWLHQLCYVMHKLSNRVVQTPSWPSAMSCEAVLACPACMTLMTTTSTRLHVVSSCSMVSSLHYYLRHTTTWRFVVMTTVLHAGVAHLSPMAPSMKCAPDVGYALQSPTRIVGTLAARGQARLPRFTLIHGEKDVVSVTIASSLHTLLLVGHTWMVVHRLCRCHHHSCFTMLW